MTVSPWGFTIIVYNALDDIEGDMSKVGVFDYKDPL